MPCGEVQTGWLDELGDAGRRRELAGVGPQLYRALRNLLEHTTRARICVIALNHYG
jgi:hypothetical protein